MEPRPKG